MLKDSTVISAIGNADEEKTTEFVKYEDILTKVKKKNEKGFFPSVSYFVMCSLAEKCRHNKKSAVSGNTNKKTKQKRLVLCRFCLFDHV